MNHEIKLPHPQATAAQNAARLSIFSAAAYYHADVGSGFHTHCYNRIRKLACSRGDSCTLAGRGNAKVLHYLSDKANVEVAAIAGTNDDKDRRNDLDFDVHNLRDWCHVNGFNFSGRGNEELHAGMLAYAGFATYGIRAATEFKSRTLYLTGHSLGGVAACIVPHLLPECRPRGIYTFGAPRFLRKGTVLPCHYPIYRYVRNHDPVPWFPRLLYEHPTSDVAYIRYEGSLYPRRTLLSSLSCMAYWALWISDPIPGAARVHAIEHYVQDLNPTVG